MSKSTTVNQYGFTPFANGGCQNLLQSTRMGSRPLLMIDVKIYFSQQEWVHTLCLWWMSKSTTVNKNGFTPFANGRCQSLLQSTNMGSHPLLIVDVKVSYSQQEWIHTLCYWWMSKSTSVNKNTLLLMLNQYVFISSMSAFLKMFWLFECWLSIYL